MIMKMTDISITLNGDPRRVATGSSIADLLNALDLPADKVAVERNLAIVPRSTFADVALAEGDALEIVHFVGGGQDDDLPDGMVLLENLKSRGISQADIGRTLNLPSSRVSEMCSGQRRLTLEEYLLLLKTFRSAASVKDSDTWEVAGRRFTSRLIVGTGKYKDYAQNAAAAEASGAEIVTVAVRRVNVTDRSQPMLTDFLDPERFTYLPNTAGCFTAEDAIRTLRLAREAGGWNLVKLEVLGEARTLYPDMAETLRATEVLVKDGFDVMVYCADDPIAAKKLEDLGAVAIMPLGSLIGSGLGIQNPLTLRLIIENARVPVLVDAGVGTASDAAVAMELGCDGVLMNTAIAEAKDPILMARAMKLAVESGRLSYRAGRMNKRRYADPSSPLAGLI
jgi:thiazole synthase